MKAPKHNKYHHNFQLNIVSEKSPPLPPDSPHCFYEKSNHLITNFECLLPKKNPEAIINQSSGLQVPLG